jgi:hypothetical protein
MIQFIKGMLISGVFIILVLHLQSCARLTDGICRSPREVDKIECMDRRIYDRN